MKDARRSGIYNAAEIIHHKEYITDLNFEDDNVFFNMENLESLCLACHNNIHFSKEDEFYFDDEGNLIKK